MRNITTLTAVFLTASLPALSGITVHAHFEMGDNGIGTDKLPLDSSGNDRHFQEAINGSAIATNSSGGGYDNDAFYTFNGTNQGFYLLVKDNDIQNNNVGIEVWARTSNNEQTDRLVFGTGTGANGISIVHNGTQWVGSLTNSNGVTTVGTSASTNGEWIHLALVRDGGTSTFYANGVPTGTSTESPDPGTMPHMAVNPGATGYFQGDISQARIFTFDDDEFSISDLLLPPMPLIWTGSVNSVWDDDGTENWFLDGSPSKFLNGRRVRFDDTAPGASPLAVELSGVIEPASVLVDTDTKDYTFTGSGISGTASVVKSGGAALVLENPNSYSGSTSIQDGRVVVAPGGSLGSGTVTNGAVLEFANTDPLTVAAAINGGGSIEKTGSGSLLLSGGNSGFTGDVSVQAGTLISGSEGSLGIGPGIVTVADGATLDVNAAEFLDTVFGAKPIHIAGGGVGGDGAIINGGVSVIGGVQHLTLAGDATIGGTARWDVRGANTSVQGDHTLTKVGTNEIGFVWGTYTVRDIVVTEGRLSVEFGAVLDNSSPGTVTVTGGTLGVGDYGNPISITKPIILDGGALGTTAGGSSGNASIAAPVTLSAVVHDTIITRNPRNIRVLFHSVKALIINIHISIRQSL